MRRHAHAEEMNSANATRRIDGQRRRVSMRDATAPYQERMKAMMEQREADKSVNWQDKAK